MITENHPHYEEEREHLDKTIGYVQAALERLKTYTPIGSDPHSTWALGELYRKRGYLEIKGSFGFHLRFGGTGDESPTGPAVRARDITSRKGAVRAVDETGRGTDLEKVVAEQHVVMTSKPPPEQPDPKGEPPA